MNGLEFQDLVASSRTYRRFSDQRVGSTILSGLVDAARLAPCGNNMQLLRFKVVGEKDACDAVFAHLKPRTSARTATW